LVGRGRVGQADEHPDGLDDAVILAGVLQAGLGGADGGVGDLLDAGAVLDERDDLLPAARLRQAAEADVAPGRFSLGLCWDLM
jgi:hypothetical protein